MVFFSDFYPLVKAWSTRHGTVFRWERRYFPIYPHVYYTPDRVKVRFLCDKIGFLHSYHVCPFRSGHTCLSVIWLRVLLFKERDNDLYAYICACTHYHNAVASRTRSFVSRQELQSPWVWTSKETRSPPFVRYIFYFFIVTAVTDE